MLLGAYVIANFHIAHEKIRKRLSVPYNQEAATVTPNVLGLDRKAYRIE